MNKIDMFIGDVQAIIEKLGDLLEGLKQFKDEIEAVEKARARLRGKRLSRKNGDGL